jgi:DNA-binding CsgD family transcriptional regulator
MSAMSPVLPILGREVEIAAVDAFLDRVAREASCVVIEGPPGIGKSLLWQHGVRAARDRGFIVYTSRPAEGERELGDVVLGDLFAAIPEPRIAALPAPRRRAFDAALLRRDDATLPLDARALGVALVTLLEDLASDAPVLLAIDDEQWMDASSAGTLAFALRRLQDVSVSLLVARRETDRPQALDDAFAAERVERIAVGPLSVGALHVVVRDRLGATLSRPAQVRLHELSGGNPFYAVELARAQAAEGQSPGRSAGVAAMVVPPTLERLVQERLGALDRDTTAALLLVAAQGRLPVAAVEPLQISWEPLETARRAGVLDIDAAMVRFSHPLLASTIYQAAPPAERRSAHRRLAAVVEDPIHRARHLALAADGPRADLAATIEAAARIARDRGAPIAVAELAEHALRLTPLSDTDARLSRAAAAARAHAAAGDGATGGAIARQLVADAPAGPARAEALLLASEFEASATALALLEEALREAAGSPRLQAAIHARLAEEGYFGVRDRVSFVDRHAGACLQIAEELDDDALRARALSILAFDRLARGRDGAVAVAERAFLLAERLDDRKLRRRTAVTVAHVLAWIGPTDRARRWIERRLADWAEHDELTHAELMWYLALVEVWGGRWTVADDGARKALELFAEYGMETPFDYFPAALVALHRGELDRARTLSERALALGGQPQGQKGYFAILAACDSWTGNAASAIPQFEKAEAATTAIATTDPGMRHWVPDHAEALLQVGRVDEAAQLVGEWEADAIRLDRPRLVADAIRTRGLIAAARGDAAVANALLDEAIARHAAIDDTFGQARALLALGANRRRDRQKRSARAALEASLAAFEGLGARTWAAAARDELARIGGRSRIEGLSPSELSVATLAAEGRTNREIAASLFLGERTIASHLTHIYAKLGVRSRTELVRHLAGKVPTS